MHAEIAAEAAPTPELGAPLPREKELEQLRAMTAFLARTGRGTQAERIARIPAEMLTPNVLDKLHSAMRRLLGGDVLMRHRRCQSAARHERRRICHHCGYSDNLYLQELERILKRIRLPELKAD